MHTGLEETGDWNRVAEFYAERATADVGLIITGGIAPNREGAVFPNAAALISQEDICGHKVVVDRVHDCGGRIAMQILHAGRYAYSQDCVAPSAVKSRISPYSPTELDESGINKQIGDIVATAVRAREAGYDGIEIMGSEGYFLNQFLARRTNHRTDRWGGSYKNRMRLPVETLRRTRMATGDDFLIIFRLSIIDLVPDGSSWPEVVQLARAAETAGADIINSGIGWHESSVPTIAASVPRGAFAWVTKKLMGKVKLPIVVSNRINSPDVAERLLAEGYSDLVSMARPFLADSEFVRKAKQNRAHLITPCIACNQACLDHTFTGKTSSCLVNPRACHETQLQYTLARNQKSIAIVGAGPAGLSAALVAAERGHKVTLFEKANQIGGQLNLACRIPGKDEFIGLLNWYRSMLAELDVKVVLKTEATAKLLTEFEEVIVATGVLPNRPAIAGINSSSVMTYAALLSGDRIAGQRTAIIGAGGIGFDVAEYLSANQKDSTANLTSWMAEWGIADPQSHRAGLCPSGHTPGKPLRSITLMQRKAERLGRGLGKTTGWIIKTTLRRKNVSMKSGVRYLSIEPAGVHITHHDSGKSELVAADTVVVCAGQLSDRRLYDSLTSSRHGLHIIGGALKAAQIDAKQAIDQGAKLATKI